MTKKLRDTNCNIKLLIEEINERLKSSNVRLKIEQLGNRLALRGTLPPKPGTSKDNPHQQRVYLGVSANPAGFKVSEAKAREIGAQLDLGSFSWDPYLDEKEMEVSSLSSLDLWDRYANYRKPIIAETTLRSTYARTRKKLARFQASIWTKTDALKFREWLLLECRPITAKKYLTQLNACYNWAIQFGLTEKNPFLRMAKELKATSDHEPDPFTKSEIASILIAFESDPQYSNYSVYHSTEVK